MNTTWFRIKFGILILIAIYVGIIALPQSVQEKFPAPIAEKLASYQAKLGIDLSGGTSLEYNIDFTKAQSRSDASKLDDDKNNDFEVDKEKIAKGVVKTLKKRIDPDGTKEVGVFYSDRGEEVHVIVELTASIDTPENRAKLEKVTSLEFKEPISSEEQQKMAENILSPILSKEKSFSLTAESLAVTKTGDLVQIDATQENLSTFFDTATAEKISALNEGDVLDTTVKSPYGNAQAIIQMQKKNTEENSVLNEIGTEEKENITNYTLNILTLDLEWKDTGLGGTQFRVAKVGQNQNGIPVTDISFDIEGGKMFGDITGKLSKHTNTVCGSTGDRFAIFVDGENISAPCVRERIDGGNAQISFGAENFAAANAEAKELTENLNSGATPAPVTLVSERKISASLGESAFIQSVNAALIGFALVALWMLFFYRFFGFLAILALAFYAGVFLFMLKVGGFLVLTLSGVAGIILSIGMAVDANILIFERIREELQDGNSFSDAIQEGFDRAWTSIRDSNTSSLITSFILFALGTSIIKAFALTLAIGIVISMFTAIVFTRYLVWFGTPKCLEKNLPWLVGKNRKK